MRLATPTALLIVALFSVVPTYAQGRGNGHANPPATAHGNPHAATPKTAPPSSTPSTTTAPHVNPIAQKISANPQLASRITTLLPSGLTLDQASAGFRNQGQFIAAVHVSHNLNIPFADLKSAMVGTTGSSGATRPLSLGQAIHQLRPNVDADDAAKRGVSEADNDISGKSSTTTTRK